MPSGVVKWFDPGRGVGVIALDGGGGEAVAHRSAIHGGAERMPVEGERVCFDVTRDADGVRADNIRRPAPGYCAPAEEPRVDAAARQRAGGCMEAARGVDEVDACPWCVLLWEADAGGQQPLGQRNGSPGASATGRRVGLMTAVWAGMAVLVAVTIATVALSVVVTG